MNLNTQEQQEMNDILHNENPESLSDEFVEYVEQGGLNEDED